MTGAAGALTGGAGQPSERSREWYHWNRYRLRIPKWCGTFLYDHFEPIYEQKRDFPISTFECYKPIHRDASNRKVQNRISKVSTSYLRIKCLKLFYYETFSCIFRGIYDLGSFWRDYLNLYSVIRFKDSFHCF